MTGAALLAALASIGYGTSDTVSGAVLRRHTAGALALWAQLVGLAVLAAVVLGRRAEAATAGLLYGLLAGAVGGLAVLLFYAALQRGRTAVVAPVAGTGVVLPVLVEVLTGAAVDLMTGLGVAVVVVGVVVVSSSSGAEEPLAPVPGPRRPVPAADGCRRALPGRSDRAAAALAVAAAVGFGVFFLVLDLAVGRADQAGAAPDALDEALAVSLAVQVGALLVTSLAATTHSRACLRPDRALLAAALAVGLLDVASDVGLTAAVSQGPLAVVAPLASLDPVVAVLLATGVLRERLTRVQAVGVTLAAAGVVLVAGA